MLSLLITLLVGGVAGWMAGKIMGTPDGGVVRNILLGLVGGIVGSIALKFIGITGSGMIGGCLVSVVGACILIWLSRKLSR